MSDDNIALIRFKEGWAEDGVSEDGLPRYRPTVRIVKSVPPLTQVEYEATERDFEEYPGPYQLFQKEIEARAIEPSQHGFPLALWPVISPAMFKLLTMRDIVTVEQLAKFAGRRDGSVPGNIVEVADRAKQMIALSANLGKFEAQLLDKDRQLEAYAEQVKELQASLSAANALVNTLKMKVA